METGGGSEKHDSHSLREFHRKKEDNHGQSHSYSHGSRNLTGLTLNAVLNESRESSEVPLNRIQSNRTLLDIIRDEGGNNKDNKKSWKSFKEKLRLRRSGSGHGSSWISTVPIPASDIPIQQRTRSVNRRQMSENSHNHRSMSRRASSRVPDDSFRSEISQVPNSDCELPPPNMRSRSPSLQRNASRAVGRTSGRFDHRNSFALRRNRDEDNEDGSINIAAALAAEEEEEEGGEGEGGGAGVGGGGGGAEGEGETGEGEEGDEAEEDNGGEAEPVRMSLMALLAETDKEMGLDGNSYSVEDEEEEEEEEEEDGSGAGYNNCCVCMVRHKGAAFIPCGHTFCRLCSRELWVQRGNCPLCNNYILEILDIF